MLLGCMLAFHACMHERGGVFVWVYACVNAYVPCMHASLCMNVVSYDARMSEGNVHMNTNTCQLTTADDQPAYSV